MTGAEAGSVFDEAEYLELLTPEQTHQVNYTLAHKTKVSKTTRHLNMDQSGIQIPIVF